MNTTIKIAVFTADELEEFVVGILSRAGAVNHEPMTCSQFGKKVGLCADTIRDRVKAGLIRRVPNTKKVLIPASEVDRYLGQ